MRPYIPYKNDSKDRSRVHNISTKRISLHSKHQYFRITNVTASMVLLLLNRKRLHKSSK